MKRDPREIFRGDDPSRILRAAASDLMARAVKNGLRRERESELWQYGVIEELPCTIELMRHEPPLWRLQATFPGVGPIELYDLRRDLLIPELRFRISHGLVSAALCDQQTARSRAAKLIVRPQYVLLRDSQRHATEYNRPMRKQ